MLKSRGIRLYSSIIEQTFHLLKVEQKEESSRKVHSKYTFIYISMRLKDARPEKHNLSSLQFLNGRI